MCIFWETTIVIKANSVILFNGGIRENIVKMEMLRNKNKTKV